MQKIMAGLFVVGALWAAPARAEMKCGAHEHLVVEKDEDEGGTMKRCVCDEGWDETGPAPPCRAKAGARTGAKEGAKEGEKDGGKAPAKDGGKGKKK